MLRCRRGAAIPLLLPIGYNIFVAAVVNALERYRLQIDPYLLVFASSWIVIATRWTWTRLLGVSSGGTL